jgi:hypothetical protein
MAINKGLLINLISWNTTGDLGPLTIYRSVLATHVYYARTPAIEPPSRRQIVIRYRFNLAALIWAILTLAERAMWAAAANECANGITGYNLFVAWQLKRDNAMIAKLLRHYPLLNIRTHT